MQFSVKTDEINYGLSMVVRALVPRAVKQIYEGVLVETLEDRLSLTCTDGDITIRAQVPARIDEDGRAILPAKLFSDLMRYQAQGDVNVQMDGQGKLKIKSMNSVSNMISMEGDDYPEIDDIAGGSEAFISCAKLKEAVSRCSRKPSRRLSGIIPQLVET